MKELEKEQRDAVVKEALSWVGTPYHHEGRVKGAGVDCAMLEADVFYQCGLIPWIDPRPYSSQWHLHHSSEKYLDWLFQYGQIVCDPLPGNIALFRFGKCIAHAGIIKEWPIIIHAYQHAGICTLEDISAVPALYKRLYKEGFLQLKGWIG